MRLGLRDLREHKFKSFQDTLNKIYNSGQDIEALSHYHLHCPDYLQKTMTLLNTVRSTDPNILDLNNAQLN